MSESHSNRRVLVVEDEPGLAELYAAWIRDNHEVEIAHDGREALDRLNGSIDVVLLDRRMPGYSGDEILEHLRAGANNVQVVVISAVVPDFDIIGMQFDAYLTKPVDIDDICDAIEDVVSRADLPEAVKQYYRLLAEKETLEDTKRRTELESSEEFQGLMDDIAEAAAAVEDTLDDDPTWGETSQ